VLTLLMRGCEGESDVYAANASVRVQLMADPMAAMR
jgi:hypothetical protein